MQEMRLRYYKYYAGININCNSILYLSRILLCFIDIIKVIFGVCKFRIYIYIVFI